MIDLNKHRFYLVQLLKEVYADKELAISLGFKGGTALMFFYGLPRFSVDLDFDLLKPENEEKVYQKLHGLIKKYGEVWDEANKFYSLLLVLDYGLNERKMKIEVSKRSFGSSYEVKSLLGINVQVMQVQDMFANKLCALLDRQAITNRDIFDIWFLMKRQTPVNPHIVENRTGQQLPDYLDNCIGQLEIRKNIKILDGLGELIDDETLKKASGNLLPETIELLRFYRQYPIRL